MSTTPIIPPSPSFPCKAQITLTLDITDQESFDFIHSQDMLESELKFMFINELMLSILSISTPTIIT
jgi:hypothetical protein